MALDSLSCTIYPSTLLYITYLSTDQGNWHAKWKSLFRSQWKEVMALLFVQTSACENWKKKRMKALWDIFMCLLPSV